jgi:hypothetical protein
MGPKVLFYYQKNNPKLCIQKENTIHAWGPVMTISGISQCKHGQSNSAAERD